MMLLGVGVGAAAATYCFFVVVVIVFVLSNYIKLCECGKINDAINNLKIEYFIAQYASEIWRNRCGYDVSKK